MSGNGNGGRTFVAGVGVTKFERNPRARTGTTRRWRGGYCYGESTSGQRADYQLGLTGIPVVDVRALGLASSTTSASATRRW